MYVFIGMPPEANKDMRARSFFGRWSQEAEVGGGGDWEGRKAIQDTLASWSP